MTDQEYYLSDMLGIIRLACAKHLPGICVHSPFICQAYAWQMSVTCLAYAWHAACKRRMCLAYAWHVPGIRRAYAWHMPAPCRAYAGRMKGMCQAYVRHMPGICLMCSWVAGDGGFPHGYCRSQSQHSDVAPDAFSSSRASQ